MTLTGHNNKIGDEEDHDIVITPFTFTDDDNRRNSDDRLFQDLIGIVILKPDAYTDEDLVLRRPRRPILPVPEIHNEAASAKNHNELNQASSLLTQSEFLENTIESLFAHPVSSSEEAPSMVYAVFYSDLNIVKIHEAIRQKFCKEIYDSKEKIEMAMKIRENARDPTASLLIVERRSLEKDADEIENEVNETINHSRWQRYSKEAIPLIRRYLQVATGESRGRVFVCEQSENNASPSSPTTIGIERSSVISDYLNIAKGFISLQAFGAKNKKNNCDICGESQTATSASIGSEDHNVPVDDFGTVVCQCGKETIGIERRAAFKDSSRVDPSSRNAYNDLNNFIKRLDAFEGKQRTQPPPFIYKQLEDFFLEHPEMTEGKTPAQIRDSPVLPNGKKEGTTIEILERALSRTQNSAFYRDIELIAHVVWGWAIPDITSTGLREIIVQDYINTQQHYEEIKERDSSLNVNLRLYFHLRARGYECKLEDFKGLSSKDSIEYHERTLAYMCKMTNLSFFPLSKATEAAVERKNRSERGEHRR